MITQTIDRMTGGAETTVQTRPYPEVADEPVRRRSERRNLLLIVQMRWIAVLGQVAAILLAAHVFHLAVPAATMLAVAAFLAFCNVYAFVRSRRQASISGGELLAELLLDVAVLTAQLYLSGGATNPFVSLYLLQVILGAVLFETATSVLLVIVTTACYFALTRFYQPIAFPHTSPGAFLNLHLHGMFACFVLAAVLLCAFVSRINANLRRHDAELAELRQQAAEQAHVVRLGLLASGAAHELGTPLATMAVLLGDWRRVPAIAGDADFCEDVAEMQRQVTRCREILTGVLLSSGQVRGEGTVRTGLSDFLDATVREWSERRDATALDYDNAISRERTIVADLALRQVLINLLDNAREACRERVTVRACSDDGHLVITVSDDGPGFGPPMLERIGQPYHSSKDTPERGLGLFLVVNVVRTLGGTVAARNGAGGGAEVTIDLPLASLEPETQHG